MDAGSTDTSEPDAPLAAISIATSHGRSCAVSEDRDVYCWGESLDETSTPILSPRRVAGVENASSVYLAGSFACAQTDQGVVCWGVVQTPTPDREPEAIAPRLLEGSRDAASLSVTNGRVCVVRSGGQVRCWGPLFSPYTCVDSPALDLRMRDVPITDATEVFVGGSATCALRRSGSPICIIGDSRTEPRQFELPFADAVSLTVHEPGGCFPPRPTYCATLRSGAVDCLDAFDPDVVERVHDGVPLAANFLGSRGGGCVVTRDGDLYCGEGFVDVDTTQVDHAFSHACGIRASDGTVVCWGDNSRGQLGIGEPARSETSRVTLGAATALIATDTYACALVEESVLCWGENVVGETPSREPRAHLPSWPEHRFTRPTREIVFGVRSMATSGTRVCVIQRRDGSRETDTVCWGQDLNAHLMMQTPTVVPELANATGVAPGDDSILCGTVAGEARCFGRGAFGTGAELVYPTSRVSFLSGSTSEMYLSQAGLSVHAFGTRIPGTTSEGGTLTAVQVDALSGVRDAFGGVREISGRNIPGHVAREASGALYWWRTGRDGIETPRVIAREVRDIDGRCFARINGTVACDEAGGAEPEFVDVDGINDAIEVAAGRDFGCARNAAGQVRCWGSRAGGRLGDGSRTVYLLPEETGLRSR